MGRAVLVVCGISEGQLKTFVLTDIPSPYQVEFFNEIESRGVCELQVGYLRGHDPNRRWKPAEIRHESIELDRSLQRVRAVVQQADLVVFNYYLHPYAEELIDQRAKLGAPWCFWGERPGFHQPAWAGRLLRKWKLAKLHASPIPIWGIGKFAIEGYRREFGNGRAYCNLPYFSDLQRFKISEQKPPAAERVFLFSGSLIRRKGVDLVARAFVRLAREVSNVRLRIAGEGELRQTLAQVFRPVSDRVEFAAFRDWNELPGEYARADVLCVPSRYDGWGLVVPEGLASGLPVIATDQMGAALEFLETGRNGWLIPVGDEDALLSAMREAALSDICELGRRAQESVSTHTLENGAARFFHYTQQTIESWAAQSKYSEDAH